MEKVKSRFWFDFITLIFLLFTAITGIINLVFHILEDHHDNLGFIGIDSETWVTIHAIFAIITIIFITIHILLHVEWISFALKKIFKHEENPPIEK